MHPGTFAHKMRRALWRRPSVGRRGRDAGQSLVEFAVILPLFLTILLGAVEFGRGFQSWLTLSNAAATGARTAAVGQTAAEVEAATRNAAVTLDQGALTVQVTNAEGPTGEPVTVHVEYTMTMMTPFFAPLVPGGVIPLEAEATQRLE